MNKYLTRYQVAVQQPGVSGFEVLDMLMVRDKLLTQAATLSAQEQAQLAVADQQLLANAADFYTELAQITGLDYEREQRKSTPAQWWWYLDVLLQLPDRSIRAPKSALMPA